MSLFTPTAYYFGQPVPAAVAGQVPTLRADPSASFLIYAMAGTYFSGSFSMTDYNTDLSAQIRGSGNSYGNLPATGSGTVAASAGQVKWTAPYATSMLINGAKNGGGQAASDTNFSPQSGDYTIECWVNSASTGTRNYFYKQSGVTSTSTMNWGVLFSDGRNRLVLESAAELVTDSVAQTRVSNTWYHVAMCKQSTTYSVYFNGNRIINFTNASYGTLNAGSAAAAQLFGRSDDASQTAFYYQDYRIYKGVAKYSGATITTPLSMVYYA